MQKDNTISVWSHPPAVLSLEPQHVDIWRARLQFPNDSLKTWEMTLSTDETERAARFHFPADRDRFIAAHGCLRGILARYLHCESGELTFSVNQYGKPAIIDHELEFNLSHSRDFSVVAVTQKRKVGVDVERIRPGISSQAIARQYFSKVESAQLETLSSEEREVAFFTCWTRKEAYIKAQGLGLSLPLESFDVSLAPNESASIRATRPDPQEAARWTLLSLDVDSSYQSAVAVEGQNLEFRLWDWNLEIRAA